MPQGTSRGPGQGFPSIRVYRKGINSQHEYESYIGDRTPEALAEYAENMLQEIGGAQSPNDPRRGQPERCLRVS